MAVVTMVVALFVATSAALVVVGERVTDRARAQSAADAVALASLDGGRPVAEAFADRHGAQLTMWARGPGPNEVTVTVRVGGASATARASDEP